MKKRYVYYDKKTGFITDILSSKKQGRSPYIECDNSEVQDIIMGVKGVNQYVIAHNRETDECNLMEKNNVMRFRNTGKDLYKIPYRKNAETDLKLIYYTDNVLEATLDMSRISPLYQTNFREEVRFERGTDIRILVKEKGSGNLLKEIIIDAQKLLDSGQLFFEFYESSSYIEFFTYKMFESYSWCKEAVRLTSPVKEKIKFDVHKADSKVRSKGFSYHLEMKPTSTGIKIKNNVKSLKLIRFYNEIEFFVVDKHDPNILHDKFSLNKEDMKSKNILVKLKTDVKGKSILYNHKYISVLLEG